ncbi:MAG TPA: type IV toxin-antitoxin system AbiEi family antitoxin domain-containing protein [Cellulomonas sp.]
MHDARWVPPQARRQAGAFTRGQAMAAGMTKSEVGWRVRRGVWIPVAGAALRHAARPADEVTEAHAARLTS